MTDKEIDALEAEWDKEDYVSSLSCSNMIRYVYDL